MFAKHPLDMLVGKKLGPGEIADALRMSIIAELDAISTYLQLARSIEDEKIKRVFEDIAREEKTHVGEFLALLKHLDPEQANELVKGAKEVEELTGVKSENNPGTSGVVEPSKPGFEEIVVGEFKKVVEATRVISKKLPVSIAGRGVEAVPVEVVKGDTTERSVIPLCEISVKFRVSQRAVDYYLKTGHVLEAPEAHRAAAELAVNEDKLVVETILKSDVSKVPIGSWDTPGEAVVDIAKAVSELLKAGARRPLVLFVSPARYTKLLAVSEKTGVTDLERVKMIVDEVVYAHVVPDDKAILVSATLDALDVVYGGNGEVDYIGPEDGYHAFRAWSSLAVRVRDPRRVLVMEAGERR